MDINRHMTRAPITSWLLWCCQVYQVIKWREHRVVWDKVKVLHPGWNLSMAGAEVSYTKRWSRPHVIQCPCIHSSPKLLSMALWGAPYYQLMEETIWAWFVEGWTPTAGLPDSEVALKFVVSANPLHRAAASRGEKCPR